MLQAPSYANAQAERINRGGNATTPAAFVLDLWRHVRQSGSPGASYPYTGFRVASQVPDPGTVVAGAMVAMLIVAHQRRR